MIQRMFVTIDTKKTNYKNVGKINHGDDLILELTVLSDGDMISFNDPMVDLLVKKSDGKMIRQNSGIEHIQPNKFIIEVKKDCVTSPGLSTNQLVINDNGRISTCMFYYTILNSLEEDVIQSISSVEVLEQLDEYVIEARERMELLNNDINELEELFGATSDKLVEAENARNEAEQNRVQSEILRVNNENDRIEADNIRNQNEIDRSTSELVREQRESERILNEEERRRNESERAIDESTRQQNENARQSNESIRMSNESDRKTQENIRVTAETNRGNAETTRRNNENSRISNETERQKAMNEMKSLLEDARGFDDRVGVIEDEIEEINSSLDNIKKETNEVLNSKRIFSPKLYGNINWSTSYPITDGKYLVIDKVLDSWIGCIDGVVIDFQIKPNGSTINDDTSYFLNPSLNWLDYLIERCKERDIKIVGVKFHYDEIRDNQSNLTFNNWFGKYKNIIRTVTSKLKCDWLLYFNESSSLLNRTTSEINQINEFTNELKSLGFEVGFAGTGETQYLINNNYVYDIISFHTYPVISGKRERTTYVDSIIGWMQNKYTSKIINAVEKYPNKKIMIGEAGCGPYWECLSNPEKWDWDYGSLTKSVKGVPATLFLYGMLETFKDIDIDCACFWYNDPMLESTQKLLRKYI